jgi:peptidoglycan/xylan/chitin deacetylase (PgdA/CDA1 family)
VAIVCWHGISGGQEHELFPRYFVAERTYRRRLDHLKRLYRVVSLDEAVRQLQSGHVASRQVVLTFDDGDFNFLSLGVPILREYGFPATNYVVSSALAKPALSVEMALRELFLRSPLSTAPGELFVDGQQRELISDELRLRCAQMCSDKSHSVAGTLSDRVHFARCASALLKVDWDTLFADRHWDYMVSDDARLCVEAGFDIQLHSHTHKTTVELGDELLEDTRQCRVLIEAATGREARDYCYPSGRWARKCWPLLRQAGVRSAVTCRPGPNFPDTPVLSLRRYVDSEALHQLEFEALVCGFDWLVRWHLGKADRTHPAEDLDGSGLY